MKKILYIVFPLLLVVLYGGCSDNENGGLIDNENGKNCLEPLEIANSTCPASDVLLLCDSFFCGTQFPSTEDSPELAVDFFFPPPETPCEVIDCNTLDCGLAGLYTKLVVDEFGTPGGSITNIFDQTEPFGSCNILQN